MSPLALRKGTDKRRYHQIVEECEVAYGLQFVR